MNTFNEFFGDDWRDKIVTHRTPTGKYTRVKVRSLSPEEQLKYNPNRYKRTKSDTKITKSKFDKLEKKIIRESKTFDVYVGTTDTDRLTYKEIELDSLILATTDPLIVIDHFDKDLDIVRLKNVPVVAIKKYLEHDINSIDFIDKFNFKDVDKNLNDDQLFELAKFSDSKIFLLNIGPYLDVITIDIDKHDNDDDDFEELSSLDILNNTTDIKEDIIKEMPHFNIGSDYYDLFMEKGTTWVNTLINIIKNNPDNINTILDPFYSLYKYLFIVKYNELDITNKNKLNLVLPDKFKKFINIS